MNSKPLENLQSDVLLNILSAQNDERSIVLITSGYLELSISKIIESNLINSKRIIEDTRSYPFSVRLVLLRELDLLSEELFTAIDRFRKLRNRAAHDTYFEISQKDLKYISEPYFDSSTELKKSNHLHISDNIKVLCIFLVVKIFTEHKEIVEANFIPSRWNSNNK